MNFKKKFETKLTSLAKSCGWASKLNPVGLKKLLDSLPENLDPNVLVGYDTCDDAGVYLLNEEQALVFTADFITPPVDDPYLFGQIAAANSLSDIFAMGGNPLTCLNLMGFPSEKLGNEIFENILAGGLNKITESGAVLLGGHTTNEDEPKFGLAVTGLVNPNKIWRNVGAMQGDQLILTKSLGSGVLLNANKKNMISKMALNECLDSLLELNKKASKVLENFDVHAATDITGFGLAGHSLEMISNSKLTFNFELEKIPVLCEAEEMYKKGITTRMNKNNRKIVENDWIFAKNTEFFKEELMLDPQTNGGLLVAVPESETTSILEALHNAGVKSSARIGHISKFTKSKIIFSWSIKSTSNVFISISFIILLDRAKFIIYT